MNASDADAGRNAEITYSLAMSPSHKFYINSKQGSLLAQYFGMGGPGFDSQGRVIPKTLNMVVIAFLLGAQELRDSITTDSSVSL